MKTIGKEKLRDCILGAFNGAFYSVTMLLLIWRLRAAADERNIREGQISGDYIHLASYEKWESIVIIWLVAFTLASLIIGSLWRKKQKNFILYWEVVGVVAVAAWNAFSLIGSLLDNYRGESITYGWVTSWHNPLYGPITFVVVILVNLAYGYLIRLIFRKLEQWYDVDGINLRSTP